MRLFAISDLHLPGGQEKPMDVFGEKAMQSGSAWIGMPVSARMMWY